MKEFLKNIFPSIIGYSKSLDDQSILMNKPWVLFSGDPDTREVWIFKRNHELIYSRDGIADKGNWEYLPEAKSLYLEIGNVKRLVNQAFIDDIVLLLRLDGGKEFLTFANELKIDDTFKIKQYLEEKYQHEYIESPNPDPLLLTSEIIPPPTPSPPTLDEKIKLQRIEISNKETVLIVFIIIGAISLLGIILTNKRFSNITLLAVSLLILVLTISVMLPNYRASKRKLQELIDQKKENDSVINDVEDQQ
jgi:hypothetical protein